MIKEINKTEKLNAQLKKEGKVIQLNNKEHAEAIETMNEELEKTRRDYQVKNRESQVSAAKVILTS